MNRSHSIAAMVCATLLVIGAVASASSAPPVFVEDFEATTVGEIPTPFTKVGDVAVVDDAAHSGTHALRVGEKEKGPRRIVLRGDVLAALGGTHWGRLYFKVRLPHPMPLGAGDFPVIHSTLVAGKATSPLFDDAIEVRLLDTVLGPAGTHQFIYNVQPAKRPEFGTGGAYTHRYTDAWTLAEWFVDHATQSYRLFINGEEVRDVALARGAGNFANAEIPAVFESLSFGWYNYQRAGEGFVAWIDDIALGKERLGATPSPAKR